MVAMSQIEELVGRIAEQFRPERIVLFGSYAAEAAASDSDVDLLVVMEHEGNPLGKAVEIRRQVDARFPVDLIVRDPRDLRRRIEQNDWFLKEIVQKGRVMYEAADH